MFDGNSFFLHQSKLPSLFLSRDEYVVSSDQFIFPPVAALQFRIADWIVTTSNSAPRQISSSFQMNFPCALLLNIAQVVENGSHTLF